MKYRAFILITFALLAWSSTNAQNTIIDKYFAEYVGDDRFTVTFISARMMQVIEGLPIEGLEMSDKSKELFRDVTSDLTGLRILASETDPSGLFTEMKTKINVKEYPTLITVQSVEGGDIEFLIKETEGNIVPELVMIHKDLVKNRLSILSFEGQIDLGKVILLATEMGKNATAKKKE